MGECLFAMGYFIVAEFCDCRLELGIAVESLELARVMLVDHLFDGGRTSHGCAGAKKRGCGTECKSRDVPHRRQRRWSNAALVDQPFEPLQMPLLLLRHSADAGKHLRVTGDSLKNGKLPLVNAPGAVFAGMIDADYFLSFGLMRHTRFWRPRPTPRAHVFRPVRASRNAAAAANAKEMRAL